MNHQFDEKGIPLNQMSYLDLYWLGLGYLVDYQDVRLKGVVRQVELLDDFANVTRMGRAKSIPPMMIHWGDVHLMEVGHAKRNAQTRVGQVDAEVDFAYETVLQNMMDYYLVGLRLAKGSIQSHLDCFRLAGEEEEDVVGFAHLTAPRNMMNYHLHCFRFARKGIHQMSQVDAL